MRDVISSDIAVIGMACRFPGARDPEQYWENLAAGRISIKEVPAARWRWQDYVSNSQESSSYCRWGGFIEDADAFDASFFNVSAREAESMDPQQRLGLEIAWSCFEDAGMRPSQLSGQNVGVFLGFTNLDYKEIVELSTIDAYYATGTLSSVIANRISYYFNLRGPSVALDTACSSSLQAIHMACHALRDRECELALAGGISLLLTPKRFIWYGKAEILSPTGTLRTFDENADGTVRGEGAGFILLKPLARAIADGNRIIGVIKGSAVNHGGKNYTLTYPSANAQTEVIVNALQAAGVKPSAVSYVEAHGTGTVKGDPIEVQGLVQAFHSDKAGVQSRNGDRPWCGLGSVKPNIGHLEGAAGIAGVIKVLLALRHRTLPPLVNFTKLNSRISPNAAFYFVDKLQAWEHCALPRIAGVSSFGFAGTNAHVVVAEAPEPRQASTCSSRGMSLVLLSARSAERLKEQARDLRQAIARQGLSDNDLERVAFTLQVGREAMQHRMAMTVSSMKELELRLAQFVEDKAGIEGLYLGEVKADIETLAPAANDELQLQAIGELRQEGNWSKLLERWVQGTKFEWESLYGEMKPPILSLPTYPFARERYWVSQTAESFPVTAGCTHLHPLVHQNTSNLAEQRFSSTFTGREFFLADHRIQGRRVLPAVAYLEMAREAVTRAVASTGNDHEPHASTCIVKNLVWLRRVVVTQPVQVHICVFPNDRGEIAFEVYSDSMSPERVIYAQGVAETTTPVEARLVDVEALARQYDRGSYSPEACYSAFAELGIEYGERHRGIEGLHVEGDEVVARLSLPTWTSDENFVLHPGVIDSGLQAIIGFRLASGINNEGQSPFVPFELQKAEIYGPCAPKMWAVARRNAAAGGKSVEYYDIELCDQTGRACVRLKGLSTRVIESNEGEYSRNLEDTQKGIFAKRFEHSAESNGKVTEKRAYQNRGHRSRFSSAMLKAAGQTDSSDAIVIDREPTMWARIRQNQGKYDIDLSDEYGRVNIRYRGWNARPPEREIQNLLLVEAPSEGEVILTPVWEPLPVEHGWRQQAPTVGCVVIIGGTKDQRLAIQRLHPEATYAELDPEEAIDGTWKKVAVLGEISHVAWIVSHHSPGTLADDSIIDEQRCGVFLGFRLIKAMLAAGYGDKPLLWTVMTTEVEAIQANERTNPTHASVHGLMGSLANEYTNWTVRLIDLPKSHDWPWEEIFAMQASPERNAFVYRGDRWYQQQLLPYRLINEAPLRSCSGEVYVIIGGHGGIGCAWSEMLLRQSHVQLVWIGRRQMDDVLQAQLERLAKLGPMPCYISADATDRQQLERARSMILHRFGRIDGLVHAAMVLKDQSLANMTEEVFRAVIRPKIEACVRLAQVFGQDALRFVLFFSSCNVFIKSAGQSNYVAGCTFEDNFARRMSSEWSCRVHVINWGYWGTVGAVASERYHSSMARRGFGSIELPAAARILDELLSGRVVQMAYLNINQRQALQGFDVRSGEWTTSFRETLPSCLPAVECECKEINKTEWSLSPNWQATSHELDAIALDLLGAQLHSMGLFGERMAACEPAQFNEKICANLRPWVEHSIRLLETHGYPVKREQQLNVSDSAPVSGAIAWEQWKSRKGQWLTDRDWASRVQLVEATLHALPAILTGRLAAAKILFADCAPASIPAAAKAVRGGPVVRFCYETIARAVVHYIEKRRRQDPHCDLRILDIGARADRITETILEAIEPHASCVKEYACTGSSEPPSSTPKTWAHSDRAYVTNQTFDVERGPDGQGIALDHYDLVIASNVLHTTKDIRTTLRNVKAVLRTNGLLILHELAANTVLDHLTIGLLDERWLFADSELRMPGGPALIPEMWRAVLHQEGFKSVLFPAGKAHDYGHQVIVAESDGVIRQSLIRPLFADEKESKTDKETDNIAKTHATKVDKPAAIDQIISRSRESAIEHLLSRVRLHTAKALGIDAATLDLQSRSFADILLGEVGVDSLSSTELRNALRQDLGVDLPVQRILGEKVRILVDVLYDELLIQQVTNAEVPDASEGRETYVF